MGNLPYGESMFPDELPPSTEGYTALFRRFFGETLPCRLKPPCHYFACVTTRL